MGEKAVTQTTSDPGGHLWSVRRTFPGAGPRGLRALPPAPRPPPALVFPVLPLPREHSWALPGVPHLRLPCPGPRRFLSASPLPAPIPRSTPAHLSPSQGKPSYLPVPHFGKYGHRGSALLAMGPRRAWAGGLGRARSLESLRQILLFTCSPTSHLVIKSWVATCRRMRAGPGIYSASPSPSTSRS